ncbi:fibro-slime domain protein [Fibrobacteria bacterium R8-3-H12]
MNRFLSLAAMLCFLLFFSCTSNIELPPPLPPSSSSANEQPPPPPDEPSSSSAKESSSSNVQGSSSSGEPPTSFELTAFIYDTDPSVHPDFSCGVYKNEDNCTETPTNTNKKSSCAGVKKNLAKKTLNTTTRKIECDRCTIDQCWTSAAKFSEAFTATKGVNVQHCYDMPFSQAANGRYEFDSDKIVNANNKLVGGFFPMLLNDAAIDADCPACNTKRTAEVFAPLDEKKMTDAEYMDYNTLENDFRDGDHPDI